MISQRPRSDQPYVSQRESDRTIIIWHGWGISYILRLARKFDIGLLQGNLTQWHLNISGLCCSC